MRICSSAVVAARTQIVEGAVGMVEMALARLSAHNVVDLDEERKAAMVSNLLVVLCSDRETQPIVTVETPEPVVSFVQPEPRVVVEGAEAQVNVTEAEAQVEVTRAEAAQVEIRQNEAAVNVEQTGEAQVNVAEAPEPQVEVQSAGQANVEVQQGEPTVNVTGADATAAGATAVAPVMATDIAVREGYTLVDPVEVTNQGIDGLQVFAASGNGDYEEIGEIDAYDAASNTAVVAVGGFLGIGERQVAYPLDQMSFQRTAAGDLEAYVGTPADQIQNLPPYTAGSN